MDFVNLRNLDIDQPVVEMIPESVCRENCVLPIAYKNGVLVVAVCSSDPDDRDTLEKLVFILNLRIEPVLAERSDLLAAIDRNYRQC